MKRGCDDIKYWANQFYGWCEVSTRIAILKVTLARKNTSMSGLIPKQVADHFIHQPKCTILDFIGKVIYTCDQRKILLILKIIFAILKVTLPHKIYLDVGILSTFLVACESRVFSLMKKCYVSFTRILVSFNKQINSS